jgi:hypothetical protein
MGCRKGLRNQQQQLTWGLGCTHGEIGDGVGGILVKRLLDGGFHPLPKAIKSFVNAGKSVVRHDKK